ncbi:MAG: hypothetical protein SFV51_04915 [Bryobacteraceae bacterium]|nr:hypothetical protein [Bryobacteraceae bacterium]
MFLLLRTLLWVMMAAACLIPSAPDPSVGVWTLVDGPRAKSVPRRVAVRRDGPDGWIVVTAWFPTHVERLRMRHDGQDYRVRGTPEYETVSSIRLDAQSLEAVFRKERREVRRCTWEFAADGATCSLRCTDRTAGVYRRGEVKP